MKPKVGLSRDNGLVSLHNSFVLTFFPPSRRFRSQSLACLYWYGGHRFLFLLPLGRLYWYGDSTPQNLTHLYWYSGPLLTQGSHNWASALRHRPLVGQLVCMFLCRCLPFTQGSHNLCPQSLHTAHLYYWYTPTPLNPPAHLYWYSRPFTPFLLWFACIDTANILHTSIPCELSHLICPYSSELIRWIDNCRLPPSKDMISSYPDYEILYLAWLSTPSLSFLMLIWIDPMNDFFQLARLSTHSMTRQFLSPIGLLQWMNLPVSSYLAWLSTLDLSSCSSGLTLLSRYLATNPSLYSVQLNWFTELTSLPQLSSQ